MDDDHRHLLPLIDALLAAGNALEPHPATEEAFRPSQGGYYCQLAKPIDFQVLQGLPLGEKVHLVEQADYIWCEHCWAEIRGGGHKQAETG
ncbi:hypothetical protein [Micromonospora sp. DT47]|uniref:hypothetical protein n=1 Tax=Micromonospora sp. DT47 TaxID=3393431 RepID=UPI003CEC118B